MNRETSQAYAAIADEVEDRFRNSKTVFKLCLASQGSYPHWNWHSEDSLNFDVPVIEQVEQDDFDLEKTVFGLLKYQFKILNGQDAKPDSSFSTRHIVSFYHAAEIAHRKHCSLESTSPGLKLKTGQVVGSYSFAMNCIASEFARMVWYFGYSAVTYCPEQVDDLNRSDFCVDRLMGSLTEEEYEMLLRAFGDEADFIGNAKIELLNFEIPKGQFPPKELVETDTTREEVTEQTTEQIKKLSLFPNGPLSNPEVEKLAENLAQIEPIGRGDISAEAFKITNDRVKADALADLLRAEQNRKLPKVRKFKKK